RAAPDNAGPPGRFCNLGSHGGNACTTGLGQLSILIPGVPSCFTVAHDDQMHNTPSSLRTPLYWAIVRGRINSTSEFWTAIMRLLMTALIEAFSYSIS